MATLPNPAIKLALAEAGVKPVPQNRRIWQWLKDNGPHTAQQIGAALGLKINNVSSQCGAMVLRAMLTGKAETNPATRMPITRYATAAKMRKFELLPVTPEAKNREKRDAAKSKMVSNVKLASRAEANNQAVIERLLEIRPPVAELLDRLSVREAFKLYQELRTMFESVPAPAPHL